MTIGENRQLTPTNPAQPGAKPICKQRIVSPIVLDVTPRDGESLVLRVNPRGIFGNVDFAALPGSSPHVIEDSSLDPVSRNLFSGLRASVGVYSVRFQQVNRQ